MYGTVEILRHAAASVQTQNDNVDRMLCFLARYITMKNVTIFCQVKLYFVLIFTL